MWKVLLIIFISLVGFCRAQADDDSFSFSVDDSYARPTIWWPPPGDKNGDSTRDILISFFESVRIGEIEKAASLCFFGWRKGDGIADPKDWKSIEGEEFQMICDLFKTSIKEIVISGTTVRQKSGYYSITCKFLNRAGKHAEYRIYLVRIEGVWKLRETSVKTLQWFLEGESD